LLGRLTREVLVTGRELDDQVVDRAKLLLRRVDGDVHDSPSRSALEGAASRRGIALPRSVRRPGDGAAGDTFQPSAVAPAGRHLQGVRPAPPGAPRPPPPPP